MADVWHPRVNRSSRFEFVYYSVYPKRAFASFYDDARAENQTKQKNNAHGPGDEIPK